MRRASIALIVIAIGIVLNTLIVMGILAAPCTTPAPPAAEEGAEGQEAAQQPAFGDLTTCDSIRSSGFIILGLADAFAAALVGAELAKRRK